VAIVLGLSFNPVYASKPGFQKDFVDSVVGSGSSATPLTLSGEQATYFSSGEVGNVVFAKGRLGLVVTGQAASGSDLEDIMTKLIARSA
jgi:hypothetical protein